MYLLRDNDFRMIVFWHWVSTHVEYMARMSRIGQNCCLFFNTFSIQINADFSIFNRSFYVNIIDYMCTNFNIHNFKCYLSSMEGIERSENYLINLQTWKSYYLLEQLIHKNMCLQILSVSKIQFLLNQLMKVIRLQYSIKCTVQHYINENT